MGQLKIGSTTINNVKLGSTQVSKIYLGSNLIWSNSTYSSEMQAIIDRANALGYTLPISSTLAAMDSLISAYKASGVWNKMDRIWNFACGRNQSNLVRFSEEMDNVVYGKTAVLVSGNTTTAPDSTMTADKVYETATSTSHNIRQLIPCQPSTTYTLSFYLKAAEYNTPTFNFSDGVVQMIRQFTLTGSGSVDNNTNTTITDVGGGWYRCTMTKTSSVGVTELTAVLSPLAGSYLGNGVNGIYTWGWQMEIGSTATTYNRTPDTQLQNFARIEWKNPSGSLLTLNGGITFEESGYKGNSVDAYLGTSFIPSTNGVNYTLNNASRTAVIYQVPTTGNAIDGNNPSGNNPMFVSTTAAHRINGTNNLVGGTVNFTGTGLKSISRDNSTDLRLYNRTTESVRTATSTTNPVTEQFILRSVANYSNSIVSNYLIGASITSTETLSIRNDYNTFLSAIGLTAITAA